MGKAEDVADAAYRRKGSLKVRTKAEMEQWVSQEMEKCVGMHRHLQKNGKGWHIAHFLVWMSVLGRKLPAPSTELSARLDWLVRTPIIMERLEY